MSARYCLALAAEVPEGPGYVPVGTHPDGRVYLDVEPGRDLPEGAECIIEDPARYDPSLLGEHAPYVLEATWESEDGPARGKLLDAPAETTATELRPHRWAGE